MKIALLSAVVVLGLQAAAPAWAEEGKQVQVAYFDLNVDQSEGAAMLFRRIERAAAKVCGPHGAPSSDLARARVYGACLNDTVDRAVAAVNRPMLSQYAAEQGRDHRRPLKVAQE